MRKLWHLLIDYCKNRNIFLQSYNSLTDDHKTDTNTTQIEECDGSCSCGKNRVDEQTQAGVTIKTHLECETV